MCFIMLVYYSLTPKVELQLRPMDGILHKTNNKQSNHMLQEVMEFSNVMLMNRIAGSRLSSNEGAIMLQTISNDRSENQGERIKYSIKKGRKLEKVRKNQEKACNESKIYVSSKLLLHPNSITSLGMVSNSNYFRSQQRSQDFQLLRKLSQNLVPLSRTRKQKLSVLSEPKRQLYQTQVQNCQSPQSIKRSLIFSIKRQIPKKEPQKDNRIKILGNKYLEKIYHLQQV